MILPSARASTATVVGAQTTSTRTIRRERVPSR
jgi:hypothetical protein